MLLTPPALLSLQPSYSLLRMQPLTASVATTVAPGVFWPYMLTEGGVGCLCDRPPLVVLVLLGTGLGLPLSEDVLIYGMGARLAMLALGGRACIALWALVGVVLSDLCTVALGCALRVRH